MKTLTYIGTQKGYGAYPNINRELKKSLSFYFNISEYYNQKNKLSDFTFSHEYPIEPVLHRLPIYNVVATAWEFATPQGFPICKRKAMNTYDLAVVPSNWIKKEIQSVIEIPIEVMHWGVNPNIYYANDYEDKENIILCVGGTDKRHGVDIFFKIASMFEKNKDWRFVLKVTSQYPVGSFQIPYNVQLITEDYSEIQMADLYRQSKIFLLPARGVGYSLPVIQAIACGATVVSPPLPPLIEMSEWDFSLFNAFEFSREGFWEETEHHLYSDCLPIWFEPNIEDLAFSLQRAMQYSKSNYIASVWIREHRSWDYTAKTLLKILEGKTK